MIFFYISLWLKRFSLYKIKRKNRHEAFCNYSGLFSFNVNTHRHDLHLVLYIIKYIMGTCEPRASHLIVQQQKYTLYRTRVWYEWKLILAEHVFYEVGPCTVAAALSLANRYLLPLPTLRIFTRFWGVRLKDVSGSHVVNNRCWQQPHNPSEEHNDLFRTYPADSLLFCRSFFGDSRVAGSTSGLFISK